MFLFKSIKNLLLLVVLGLLVFWVANYKIHGEPFYKTVSVFFTSGGYKEGFKDIRSIFGGFLKTVGEQIQQDEVTEKDRKQFEKLIKDKSQEGEKR